MNPLTYWLCFVEGLLTFVSPCILPLLPVYLFYLAGTAEAKEMKSWRLLANALAFVLGFTLVFVALGATATALGSYLELHSQLFRQVSALVMVGFGLHFMGWLRLPFLERTLSLDYRIENLNFLRSLAFGLVFAFGWTPCVGIFLGAALLQAGNADSLGQGVLLLLSYSAGLGLPFLASAWLFKILQDKFRRLAAYGQVIRTISGLVLIGAGILLYLDVFRLGSGGL
jgi:cytochrome c-type biogenesis protein